MYPTMQKILIGIALLGSTEALVPAKRATTTVCCTKVKHHITAAKEQSAATAFCASYLQIPSTVVTSTTGITTITAQSTSTVTSTVTSTTGTPGTTTLTTTVTSGTSTVTLSTCPPQKVKRDAATKSEPACLKSYKTGATLSSACSCLSIAPITSTTSVLGSTTIIPRTTTVSTTNVPNTAVSTLTETSTVPEGTTTINNPPSTCTPAAPINTDPGFEDVSSSALYQDNASSGGWTISGQADFESNDRNAYTSHTGNIFVTFYGADGTTAAVSQDLGNLASGAYTLQYWYSVPSVDTDGYGGSSGTCTLSASVGGTQVDTVTLGLNSYTGNTYSTRSNPFTFTSGSALLAIELDCGGLDDAEIDVDIDDVTVTPA